MPSEIDAAVSVATNGAHTSIISEHYIGNQKCVTLERLQFDVESAAATWTDYTPSLTPIKTAHLKRLATGLNADLYIEQKAFTVYVRLREMDGATIRLMGQTAITLTTDSEADRFYSATLPPNTSATCVITRTGYVAYTEDFTLTSDKYISVDRLTPSTTTWRYSLTVVNAGCTVIINGSTKTTSSRAGQVFSGTTSSSSLPYTVSMDKYTTKTGNLTSSSPSTSITLYHQVYEIHATNTNGTYAVGHTGNTTQAITTQISYSGYTGTSMSSSMKVIPADTGKGEYTIRPGYFEIRPDVTTYIKIVIPRRGASNQTVAPRPTSTLPIVTLYEYDRNTYESGIKAEQAQAVYPLGSFGGWVLDNTSTYRPATGTLTISAYTPKFASQNTGFWIKFTS